uniref:Uncharacterized protein n=1 Tax=Avena sativa TaxID=4498 RepID=A0ACD5Y7D8_AVESA
MLPHNQLSHRPPTYPPQQQQPNDQQEQRHPPHQNTPIEPHTRSPTAELPIFYGDNAYQWLQDCEGVFELAGILNEQKIKWIVAHIRGKAKTWLKNCNVQLNLMNWTHFCELLLERFPDAGVHESMDQCQLLKQVTTINNYIDIFEDWRTIMKRDHPYLPEHFFTLRFINGLKDTLKHAVKTHKPPDLKSAFWYARQEEMSFLSVNKKHVTLAPQPRQTLVQQFIQPPNKEARVKPPAERIKEKGKCWYCLEDWTFGHKCSGIKSMVHAIQMQGHNDNEEEEEQQIMIKQLVPPLPHPLPEEETHAPPVETLMQLSIQALHGMPGAGTLSVQLSFGRKQALALIDTGSTNTFSSLQFAQQNKLQLVPIPSRTVIVAGGGELTCEYILPQHGYHVQGKEFVHDFNILPLKGYDIILGANWLSKFSPNFIDWQKRM